jgi:hypothetical protein
MLFTDVNVLWEEKEFGGKSKYPFNMVGDMVLVVLVVDVVVVVVIFDEIIVVAVDNV